MNNPLISILINNYNYQRFVSAAIDSALHQTYEFVEVVVVDDGSTDCSPKIIRDYGNKIIPIFKQNGGQASALNAGFQASRGDIIIFLDSDDLLTPEIAGKVAHAFKEHPNAAKCQFRLRVIDSFGGHLPGVLPPYRFRQPNGDVTSLLEHQRTYAHPPTSGNAFKHSVVEKLMPIPESVYKKGAPAFLMYNVGLFGDIFSLEDIGGYYRLHGSNISANNPYLVADKLQSHLKEEICERQKQIQLFREIKGKEIAAIGSADLTHIKTHLALRKLFPKHYEYGHSIFTLCRKGIIASFQYHYLKTRYRPIWAAWFIIVCLSPRKLAERLILQATDHKSRFRFLNFVLGHRDRRLQH